MSALKIRHIPPGNFFMKTLLKKTICPRYIRLELTHKCNLACVMCPSFLRNPATGRKELALGEIKELIDELSGYARKPYVSVSGGEPFLRPDIFDILRHLESRGIKYKILTNATCIAPDLLEKLKLLNPDIFQVSLDGPENIHDKIRGASGAFSRTVDTIRYIKNKTKIKVLLMCIINSLNAEYLDDILGIAENLGADICFGHLSFIDLKRFMLQEELMREEFGINLRSSRSEDINDLHNLNTEALFDKIAGIRAAKTKVNVYFTQQLSREQIAMHYSGKERAVFNDKCYYPWFGARIDPYGDVSVCKDEYLVVGNVLKEPLLSLYNNHRTDKIRRYLRKSLLPLCLRCCWCGSGDLMTTVFGRSGNLT